MTAEICRVVNGTFEVKNRDLHAGQFLDGEGACGEPPEPVPVRVTALGPGKGMDVQRIDKNRNVDATTTVHYAADSTRYRLQRRWAHKTPTTFNIYPR